MRSFLLATLSLLAATSAAAATWHVDPNGSDSAAGTAEAPWLTIQHAADAVQPGDTVVVDPGVYVGFSVSARGTAAQPIAFVANGTVAIDGASTSNQDAIEIDGGSYVTIQGFTITNATRAGISALNCDHITIRDNTADQNGKWGIFSGFCDDLTIEHNVASRSGTQHGIYASNSADNPIIAATRSGATRCAASTSTATSRRAATA
jgi:parallel beta-helix repeat protein